MSHKLDEKPTISFLKWEIKLFGPLLHITGEKTECQIGSLPTLQLPGGKSDVLSNPFTWPSSFKKKMVLLSYSQKSSVNWNFTLFLNTVTKAKV